MEVLQDYLYKLHIELILWRSLWGVTPPSVICIPKGLYKGSTMADNTYFSLNPLRNSNKYVSESVL